MVNINTGKSILIKNDAIEVFFIYAIDTHLTSVTV